MKMKFEHSEKELKRRGFVPLNKVSVSNGELKNVWRKRQLTVISCHCILNLLSAVECAVFSFIADIRRAI